MFFISECSLNPSVRYIRVFVNNRVRYNLVSLYIISIFMVQSNSVITNSSGPAVFVRYNRINLCTKMTNMTLKCVFYIRVFVHNRVRYKRVSLCIISIFIVQSNSVIKNSSEPAIFVRYNQVNLCTKMTNLTLKCVRYNRVFVNNRVRYNRASLHIIVNSFLNILIDQFSHLNLIMMQKYSFLSIITCY